MVGCGVINGVRGPRLVRRKLQDDGTVLYGFGPNWMQDKVQLLFLFPSKMRCGWIYLSFFALSTPAGNAFRMRPDKNKTNVWSLSTKSVTCLLGAAT